MREEVAAGERRRGDVVGDRARVGQVEGHAELRRGPAVLDADGAGTCPQDERAGFGGRCVAVADALLADDCAEAERTTSLTAALSEVAKGHDGSALGELVDNVKQEIAVTA